MPACRAFLAALLALLISGSLASARRPAIAEQDGKGDGAPRFVELHLGHNPGEAGDKPDPARLVDAPARLARYSELKKSYRWPTLEAVSRPLTELF